MQNSKKRITSRDDLQLPLNLPNCVSNQSSSNSIKYILNKRTKDTMNNTSFPKSIASLNFINKENSQELFGSFFQKGSFSKTQSNLKPSNKDFLLLEEDYFCKTEMMKRKFSF